MKLKKTIPLVLFLLVILGSLAQAEEVKYFDYKHCQFSFYFYDDNCLFGNEIQKNEIMKFPDYWEVHFNEGKMIYANYFSIFDKVIDNSIIAIDKPIIKEKVEFDSFNRIVVSTVNLKNGEYEINKYEYDGYMTTFFKQTIISSHFGKNGNFHGKTISIFKNNLLIKRLWFDEMDNFTGYINFDLKKLTMKRYNSNHELEEESDMDVLKILLASAEIKNQLPLHNPFIDLPDQVTDRTK